MLSILKIVYVLWACQSGGWEHDYMRELLPSPKFEHIDLPDLLKLNDSANIKPRIIVYNIENSGQDGSYKMIRDLLKQYTITILVHVGDEFQAWSQKWKYGEGTDVYYMVPLVLRQYGIWPYRSLGAMHQNVVQLPLGYMRDMLIEGDGSMTSIEAATYSLERLSSARNYSWSFIGNMMSHKERVIALDVFRAWEPNFNDLGLPPLKMREIYNNSKLVLVGRGHVNLDCYRIYEAIICGAVPIVVGPKREREFAFEFEGDFPPFIFADNWPSALQFCQNLTDSEIDKLRRENINWYISRVKYIIRKIDFILSVFP